MDIELKWYVGKNLSVPEEHYIEGEYYIERIDSSTHSRIQDYPCLYYGCYLFNILNAKYIFGLMDLNKTVFNKHFNEILAPTVKTIYPALIPDSDIDNLSFATSVTIFYDILGFIFFSYTYRVISLIKRISSKYNSLNKSQKENYLQTLLLKYQDILPDSKCSNIKNLQSAIQQRTNDINLLSSKAFESNALEDNVFFENVLNELMKIKGSKLVQQYCQYSTDGMPSGRCFATLEDKEKKKYISFSGFFDTEEKRIVDVLNEINGRKTYPSSFLESIEKLTREINVALIKTSEGVKKYKVNDSGTILPSTSIKDLINHKSFTKASKREYSCCERKIFSYFLDKTEGLLFIKMEPCAECYLGIKYQLGSSPNLSWSYGIKKRFKAV